jgi:excisionase family DNA binding protein
MNGMSDNLPELWDMDLVCANLDCSKRLVYRLTREHRIRFVRVGKELRFRSSDVVSCSSGRPRGRCSRISRRLHQRDEVAELMARQRCCADRWV